MGTVQRYANYSRASCMRLDSPCHAEKESSLLRQPPFAICPPGGWGGGMFLMHMTDPRLESFVPLLRHRHGFVLSPFLAFSLSFFVSLSFFLFMFVISDLLVREATVGCQSEHSADGLRASLQG